MSTLWEVISGHYWSHFTCKVTKSEIRPSWTPLGHGSKSLIYPQKSVISGYSWQWNKIATTSRQNFVFYPHLVIFSHNRMSLHCRAIGQVHLELLHLKDFGFQSVGTKHFRYLHRRLFNHWQILGGRFWYTLKFFDEILYCCWDLIFFQ